MKLFQPTLVCDDDIKFDLNKFVACSVIGPGILSLLVCSVCKIIEQEKTIKTFTTDDIRFNRFPIKKTSSIDPAQGCNKPNELLICNVMDNHISFSQSLFIL